MPKRPSQHKLEDKSRAKFQLAIPYGWVYRDKDKDYGIDGEVELFDDSDKAQGLIFYVQLKATESKKESSIMNVDLDIDTLEYYKTLDVPVLLVRYSEFRDCFYIKWVYKIDLFSCKKAAKTFRIKFEEGDLWHSNTSIAIEKRLTDLRKFKSGNFDFPIPYSISINEDKIQDISKPILITQIRKELSNYHNTLEYKRNEESVIEIILNKKELKINLLDFAGCYFHSIDLREKENFTEGISKDILLGVASLMIQIGQIDYCGRIIFENNLQNRLIDKQELLMYMLTPLFKSSYFEKVLELIGSTLDTELSFEVTIMSTINVLISSDLNSESKNNIIESFFRNRLNVALRRNDNTQIGIAHYNLANHYRGRSQFFDSITNYISAKRYEPNYLNQKYFYSELAGVLFLVRRFKMSAILYSKAIQLGADNAIQALYADALMFSGEYKQAVNVFRDYNNSTDEPLDEYHLKYLCLEEIIENKKINNQKRNLLLATSTANLLEPEKGISSQEQLEKSLDIDLLCGLAWFNYGMLHYKESNYYSAMLSFTMAGLVQNDDIEAWKNATICFLRAKINPIILVLIIRTAYSFNGDEFLEQLYTQLEVGNSEKDITHIVEVIEHVLPRVEKRKGIPTVRIMNEKGIFENIFREINEQN